jgi:hypothetical protein
MISPVVEPGRAKDEGPAAPSQPRATRVVRLLPSRRVLANVWLSRSLRLLADRDLDSQAARRLELGDDPTSLPQQLGDQRRGYDLLQTDEGAYCPLPISGRSDRNTVGEHGMIPWRARCVETRTSGSEDGPGRRTEGDLGTTPRSDPTPISP